MTPNYPDQAPCLYFSTSNDGVLLDVNEQLCQMLGYSKGDLIGRKADVFFTVATRIFQQTHFFPLLKMQGHAEEIFLTLKKSNGGELPVLVNAERKNNEGNDIYVHAGIVVHNRKKFEEELIIAKKIAENALNENTALVQAKQELQKHSEELDHQISVVHKQNEELRQFNRVATHDMQEPLRKLSVFLNMLLENKEQEEQKNLVNKIKRMTDQMRDILSGLQQYVWLNEEPVKLVNINLHNLLSAAKSQLEKEFPDVQMVIETEGVQDFTADFEQMYLLFYQLLSNAIRFRKEEDKAVVNISAGTLQQNQFRNVEGRYKYVEHLRIQIKDEGVGFNSEYKEQAFGLFKKLHRNSGRGVGLSLSKKIVDNHQGSISIDSKEGKGTVVTILLPLILSSSEIEESYDREEIHLKTKSRSE